MLVDLRSLSNIGESDIKKNIFRLIILFGSMTETEILDSFPLIDENNLRKYINELVQTNKLIKKHVPSTSASNSATDYYISKSQKRFGAGIKMRNKYHKSCELIRYLLNMKDNEGFLVNTIDCIGAGVYPFDFYIVCNNSVYDIVHCNKNNISVFEQVLYREDNNWDKIQSSFQKSQTTHSPYIIKEEKSRIIIVDEIDEMSLIHFRKVKYIVCKQGNDYVFKEGESLL